MTEEKASSPEKTVPGEYRVYSMNDVSTDGARDLGGPEWEQILVRRHFPLINPRDRAIAAHLR